MLQRVKIVWQGLLPDYLVSLTQQPLNTSQLSPSSSSPITLSRSASVSLDPLSTFTNTTGIFVFLFNVR